MQLLPTLFAPSTLIEPQGKHDIVTKELDCHQAGISLCIEASSKSKGSVACSNEVHDNDLQCLLSGEIAHHAKHLLPGAYQQLARYPTVAIAQPSST